MRLASALGAALLFSAALTACKDKDKAMADSNGIPQGDGDLYAVFKTSEGDLVIKLFEKDAPKTIANFVGLATGKKQWKDPRSGQPKTNTPLYDGTVFHRVIPNFMIQGGGFTPDMKQKPVDPPIKNEWKNGLKNKKYTVAMARTQVADSGTSQFFINVADNAFLDQDRDGAAYAVFGEVAAGTETVDKIAGVKTGNKGGNGDVPNEPITINTVVKISEDEAKKAGAK